MSILNTLQSQHERIASLARSLRVELEGNRVVDDAQSARTILSRLVGLLQVHFTAEDKVLYPKLMENEDPAVRRMARRFVREMGGMANTMADYASRWPNAKSIQDDADRFTRETTELLDALELRVRSEESALFEMLER